MSTTGIMGLSVSCFLPTSNVFIQPTTGHDEDDHSIMMMMVEIMRSPAKQDWLLIWHKTTTLLVCSPTSYVSIKPTKVHDENDDVNIALCLHYMSHASRR